MRAHSLPGRRAVRVACGCLLALFVPLAAAQRAPQRGAAAPRRPAVTDTAYYFSEFIFAPHPKHNHSSCIVQAANGDLLACWYRGSGERTANDVAIMGSRKRAGASSWEEPFVMADTPNFPDCNPILFIDPQGTLHLFWQVILDGQWSGAVMRTRRSRDYLGDGPPKWSWQDDLFMPIPPGFADSARAEIDRMIAAMPADRPRREEGLARLQQRRAGIDSQPLRLVLGWQARLHPMMYTPTKMLVPLAGNIGSGICAITEDWGATWRMSMPMPGMGGSQPALVRKADGTLVAYLRHSRRTYMSTSSDGGETWTPSVPTDQLNPGSSVEVVGLRNGHWIMVHNDTDRGKGRYRLAIRVSTDEGATWGPARYLENDPEPTEGDPVEYSYPSLIQAADGRLHVTHTWRKQGFGECIKHVVIDERWITEPH